MVLGGAAVTQNAVGHGRAPAKEVDLGFELPTRRRRNPGGRADWEGIGCVG
jgi:hypothetical protein